MRVRFVGAQGRRLEVIQVSSNLYQVIFAHGDHRGVSNPTSVPLGEIMRKIIDLGWKLLPGDAIEERNTQEEDFLANWRKSFDTDFKPAPFRPKIYETRRKDLRCEIFDIMSLPTP